MARNLAIRSGLCMALLLFNMNARASLHVNNVPHLAAFLDNIAPVVIYIQNSAITNGCPGYYPGYLDFLDNSDITPHTTLGGSHTSVASAVLTDLCDIQITINSVIQEVGGLDLAVPFFVLDKKILLIADSPAPTFWTCVTNMDADYVPFKSSKAALNTDVSVIAKADHSGLFDTCIYEANPSPWLNGPRVGGP